MKLLSSSIRSACSFLVAAVIVIVIITTTTTTTAAPEAEAVVSYPGFGPPPTPHYSGYLDASAGCDTDKNGPECQLHYMLAMAEDVDSTRDEAAPTIVWFNGGPACSSLQGFFFESGPFTMAAKGGILENPYSWTKAGVNFLALESPVGVGFSYCSKQIENSEPCYADDQSTAKMNKAALMDFFDNKFPELDGGDLYISGESYAGVYIPTLTKELLDDPLAKNPTGILVGDPSIDDKIQVDFMDDVATYHAYEFGFMAPDTYRILKSDECTVIINQMLKDLVDNENDDDDNVDDDDVDNQKDDDKENDDDNDDNQKDDDNDRQQQQKDEKDMRKKVRMNGTRLPPGNRKLQMILHKISDGYDARRSPVNHNKLQRMLRAAATKQKQNRGIGLPVVKKCLTAFYEGSFGSSAYFSGGGLDQYGVFDPFFFDDDYLSEYLSRDDVQVALHVKKAGVKEWEDCWYNLIYTEQYAVNQLGGLGRKMFGAPEFPDISMINFYQEIAPKLNKTWIFSGDTDAVIPMKGTRDAVQAIGFPIMENQSYRAWYYNETAASIEFLADKSQGFGTNLVASQLELAQFGGDVVNYEEGLAFITVHGAGHMVGRSRPQQSLHMLKKFLEKDEELSLLSPPLPSMKKNQDDPEKFLGDLLTNFDWYETAQGPPYVQP